MGVKVRERPKGSEVYWIYIDHKGYRKAKKIGKDKRLALEAAKKLEAKLTLGDLSLLKKKESQITFQDYSEQWLMGYVSTVLKYSTYKGYKSILYHHLIPQFGKDSLSAINREKAKKFLFEKMKTGLSPGRVKHIKSALSGILTHAVEDGHIIKNPVSKLGRIFNSKDQMLDKEISPFTAEELEKYLEACRIYYPRYYPFFLTLARTGMRFGEALGLKPGDIDFSGQFIEIKRAIVENRLTTTKSGKPRRVKMTSQLSEILKDHIHKNKEITLKKGWGKIPMWLFFNQVGGPGPLDQGNLRARVHDKICEKADLRKIRVHDLRHSYATIRISADHNIADVSRQLGHASIKITVDTYYHWIPNQSSDEVEELDNLGKNRNNPQPIRNQNKKDLAEVS
jgi:integrase